jgi:hypothetical protein
MNRFECRKNSNVRAGISFHLRGERSRTVLGYSEAVGGGGVRCAKSDLRGGKAECYTTGDDHVVDETTCSGALGEQKKVW